MAIRTTHVIFLALGLLQIVPLSGMNDSDCKKEITSSVSARDSGRELALLRSCKNKAAMILHSIEIRNNKYNALYAPEVIVRDYFLQLKHADENDITLFNFLYSAAQRYSAYKNKIAQQALRLYIPKRVPDDIRYTIHHFLNNSNYDNHRLTFPPLLEAIDHDDAVAVTHALNTGCAQQLPDFDGKLPFERALIHGKLKTVTAFLNFGISDLSVNSAHYLKLAQESRNRDLVKFLENYYETTVKQNSLALANACALNDKKTNTLRLLYVGSNPNEKDEFNNELPLDYSIANRLFEFTRELLRHKADFNIVIDVPDQNGTIHQIAFLSRLLHNKDNKFLKLFLEHGADPNSLFSLPPDEHGIIYQHPVLKIAIRNNNVEGADLLLKHGAKANAKDGLGKSLLIDVINMKNPALLEVFLEHGVDPNTLYSAPDEHGIIRQHPILIAALINNDVASTIALLTHGANANAKDGFGQPSLLWAINTKNPALVTAMVEHKANPNSLYSQLNPHGVIRIQPILVRAIVNKDVPSAIALLTHGANANAKNGLGQPILPIATDSKNPALVQALLDHKAYPNASYSADYQGTIRKFSSLAVALDNNDAPSTILLLTHGANANELDGFGEPVFTRAMGSKNPALVAAMVEHKADLNTAFSSPTGHTYFMEAKVNQNNATVRLILEPNASPNAVFRAPDKHSTIRPDPMLRLAHDHNDAAYNLLFKYYTNHPR